MAYGIIDYIVQPCIDGTHITIQYGTGGSPNGQITEPKGSLVYDATTAAWYMNTNAGTAFTALSTATGTDFGAGGLKTDLIVESTLDAGVTLENFQFKDETTSRTITTSNVPVAWTHTANGDGDDFTITVAGATDSSLGLTSQGTGVDALYLVTTAGGLKLQSAAGLSEAITGAIGITASTTYNLDAGGIIAIESSAGRIDIGVDAVNQPINIGTSGARLVTIGGAAAGGMVLDAGVSGLTVRADTASTITVTAGLDIVDYNDETGWLHYTNGAAQDLVLYLDGATNSSILLTSEGTGADAIGLTTTAGGITFTSAGGMTYAITGALTIDATGAIEINSSGGAIAIGNDNVAQALNLGTGGARAIALGSAAAASLLLDAGVGALTVNADTTAGLTVGGATTFTLGAEWDVNATGAVTIDSSGGAISIGADAVAQAVNIATGGAARAILIGNAASASLGLEAGVGALTINADSASIWTLGNNLTLNVAAALAITSATAPSSWQHTADHAADDLTIAQLGAVDASLYLTAAGTGTDAVRLQASAGGVDMDAALGFSIEAAGGAIGIGTDAVAQAVNIATGAAARAIQIGNAASASLGLEAGVGALSMAADAASTWTMNGGLTVNSTGAIAIESSGGALALGANNVAQAINIGTGGARPISIGSASAAGVDIDAGTDDLNLLADTDITITAGSTSTWSISGNNAGDLTLTIDSVNAGGGQGITVITADNDVQLGDAAGNPTLTLIGTGAIMVAGDKVIQNSAAELLLFHDDVITIVDPAATTKRVRVDAGSVTAGNTRVLTMADRDVDVAQLDVVSQADPGNGAAIPVTYSGSFAFTIGAGAETNTIGAPTFVGQRITMIADTVGGGTRAVTSTAGDIDQAGDNVMTFGTALDCCILEAVRLTAAGALGWRIVYNDGGGVALS